MNYLVTGGAGFIGSHLVDHLLGSGHSVTVLDDFNDFYSPSIKRANLAHLGGEIEILEVDLRDEAAVRQAVEPRKFDGIIHLAARAGVRPSIEDPGLYLATNINGTFHLLEAARRSGVPQLIFASSSSVYGIGQTSPFREDQCINQTISPYAATKLAGEQLCSNYSHLYGMRIVCLRFFTVYGPRQRPDLAIHHFTEHILANRPIRRFGDGSTRRDYTFVDDIIQGIAASMQYEGAPFDIFNLGRGETIQLCEMIEAVEDALGKKAIIEEAPEQPGDVPLTFANISKAKNLLGYQPATPLSKGVPRFVEWFLARESDPVNV